MQLCTAERESKVVPMNAVNENMQPEVAEMLNATFQKQRSAHLANPTAVYKERVEDLRSLKRMLVDNKEGIIAAISQDYGVSK